MVVVNWTGWTYRHGPTSHSPRPQTEWIARTRTQPCLPKMNGRTDEPGQEEEDEEGASKLSEQKPRKQLSTDKPYSQRERERGMDGIYLLSWFGGDYHCTTAGPCSSTANSTASAKYVPRQQLLVHKSCLSWREGERERQEQWN